MLASDQLAHSHQQLRDSERFSDHIIHTRLQSFLDLLVTGIGCDCYHRYSASKRPVLLHASDLADASESIHDRHFDIE